MNFADTILIDCYYSGADIEDGTLFRRIHRGVHVTLERLTVVSVRRILQARAKAAGVEGFISGHSLRVGSAVSLAQAGASVVDMQNAGRRNGVLWLGSSMGTRSKVQERY